MLKNFLVTGGSGFIGSHFIDLLLSKNCKVINIDLKKDISRKRNKNYVFKLGNIERFNEIVYVCFYEQKNFYK